MEITNKNELKIGDVIRFHNWGVGGFLFGLITECEEEPYTHNTAHIWRARSHFSLNDVDAITLIENIEDIKGYELQDFQDFLNDVKENNMKCNLDFELLFNGSLGDAVILYENNEDYDTL